MKRYKTLVGDSPDAILVEADGQLLYANAAAMKLFGAADFEALLGRGMADLASAEMRALACEHIRRAASGERFDVHESRIRRLDGVELAVEIRHSPINYGGHPATQTILRDLTPHIQAEQELQQLNTELRKSRTAALNLLQDAMTAREQAERAEAALRTAHDELEERVRQRTVELAQTVESLEEEVRQRVRAEKTVEAERQRFEIVLEMMPAYALLLRPDYTVAYANQTFRKWFGDDNGRKCYEFLFDRTEPCENCETYTVLKTGQSHSWEWIGPNGHNYDIYDYPFTDTDGSPLIMEIGLDVTAHKQAQEAVRLGEERYRSLATATTQVIWTTDPQGHVVDDMPSWRTFTGQAVEEILGWGWIQSLHPEDRERTAGVWNYSVEHKTLYETEYRIRRHDGEYRYMSVCGAPVLESDGSIREWIGTCTDITDRRQAEERIRFTNMLLELFTQETSRQDYLDQVVSYLQTWSNCQCVGIRLTDSEGYIPYASRIGFTDDFLATESHLSLKDDSCLCIRAITQTPETQDIPLMTSRGAFCCANAFQFIDNLSDDEKIRYRGTCLRHGFASLAVIPVRYRETILGAIHLADARANIIPLERVEFLEHIAMMIGEAVHRFDIEANLRDSEERYRDLVESSPEAICMIVDEAVVYVNPMAVKLMRAESTDAMIGRTMWEFIHPDSRDIAINSLNEISVDSRQVGPVEIKAICLDGSVFDAEVTATAVTHDGHAGILAMFRDITERKRQQQALQLSELRLLEAQRVGHLGNWEWDIVTDALWWSDEVYRIFGLSPQQFSASYEAFLTYIHPDDRNSVEQAVQSAVYEGNKYSMDHRIVRPDGIEGVVHEEGKVIYDANHKPIRMVGIVLDITDRIRAEEAVRQSEERFRLMAPASEDVFWMSTPGIGQMLYISPSYEKLWGKTRQSLYRNPQSFLEGVHPDDRAMLIEGLEAHAKGTWNFQYRVLQPDDTVRWVHDVGYPVRNEQGQLTMMAGMIRDITEQHNAEMEIIGKQKELRALTAQLQLAEEVERRRIAQDLHDSIGQILSFSGRELRGLASRTPEAISESLRQIAEQMDIAVNQARTLSFDLSPALLYDLGLEVAIEDLADRMSRERSLKCSFVTCPDPKPLTDDVKVLLYRSVRELMINAAKHAQAESINISCLRSSCEIYIKVEDNGRGFDVSVLKNRGTAGRGFGLFNLNERLSHIGGYLKIESSEGKGTTAILVAPLDVDQDDRKGMTNEYKDTIGR